MTTEPGAGDPAEAPPVPAEELPSGRATLADGEWHRLHPATPLLRGGIAFLAILGILIANARERLIELFVPNAGSYNGDADPIDLLVAEGLIWIAVAVLVGLVVLIIGFSWLSWRFHTFRVSDEAVEVRSGILFRTHRQAKLDRIQSVEVNRPFFARIFGASKLDISVGGQDAGVKLEYLQAAAGEALRRDVLTIASGVRLAKERGVSPAEALAGPAGDPDAEDGRLARTVVERTNDFLARDVDRLEDDVDAESVVRVPWQRVVLSTIASWTTVFLVAAVAAIVVFTIRGEPWIIFTAVPVVIGFASAYWGAFTKGMRYSIVPTRDGVRVSSGLLSTTSDTVPPGRVHAVEVTQPLIWRPFGWWQVRINKAGQSITQAATATSTTVLPVGRAEDVSAVVGLLLPRRAEDTGPEFLDTAIRRPVDVGFTVAPRRARLVSPLSWSRTGFRIDAAELLTRRGVLWRRLGFVPLARVQSVQVGQGPIQRLLRLSGSTFHTVPGPITLSVPELDVRVGEALTERLAAEIVRAAAADTGTRWAADGSGARA